MKRIIATAALSAGLTSIAGAADVGVSIQFAQPGVFGRVDIGAFPQPQVIVPQPVIIERPPPTLPPPEPIYLWVPLEHRTHWDRYCHQYHACGHPVYFVNHVWYKNNVMAHRERAEHREVEHRERAESREAEHRPEERRREGERREREDDRGRR
jgi:hypothetical protein